MQIDFNNYDLCCCVAEWEVHRLGRGSESRLCNSLFDTITTLVQIEMFSIFKEVDIRSKYLVYVN